MMFSSSVQHNASVRNKRPATSHTVVVDRPCGAKASFSLTNSAVPRPRLHDLVLTNNYFSFLHVSTELQIATMSDSSGSQSPKPSWQQSEKADNPSLRSEHVHTSDPTTQSSHAELLEQAKEFLKDDSIQNASHERKVAFLKTKGLNASDIDELLRDSPEVHSDKRSDELRTVHDSEGPTTSTDSPEPQPSTTPVQPPSNRLDQEDRREIPPIITYPEFLLKPQKPPPLITVPRLINAGYVFGTLATLTYGASKYIVEPMLETLTEARHSLASTTLTDLETLNTKLESTVSHVPYISSASLRRSQGQSDELDEENDSITSDPTELFHRDIATQTTPTLSRTPSQEDTDTHLDPTTQQVVRLSSLNDTLTSLVEALDPKEVPYLPPPANKKLRETLQDFQNVLDKLESAYNPLRGEYYSTVYAQAADSKNKSGKDNDMVSKVRTEIRNLKGAFLSARNFPTAPRPVNSYVPR